MEAITTFNSTQMHLLQMFSVNRSERALDELYDVLFGIMRSVCQRNWTPCGIPVFLTSSVLTK